MSYYKVEVCIIEDLDNNVIFNNDHLLTIGEVRNIAENLDWISKWLSFTYEMTVVKCYEKEDVADA